MKEAEEGFMQSEERTAYIKWFEYRHRATLDKERLEGYVNHLDQLSLLIGSDIYSIGLENLRKLRSLSEEIFKENRSLSSNKEVKIKDFPYNIYALTNLIWFRIYIGRPEFFRKYDDYLNSPSKNLTHNSAFTYTTEAQLSAEKFSKVTYKKPLKIAIQEEPDFFQLLQPYLWNKKKTDVFKGITQFDSFLKMNYDK